MNKYMGYLFDELIALGNFPLLEMAKQAYQEMRLEISDYSTKNADLTKELAALRAENEQMAFFNQRAADENKKLIHDLARTQKANIEVADINAELNIELAALRAELDEAKRIMEAVSKHNDYIGRDTTMTVLDSWLSKHKEGDK